MPKTKAEIQALIDGAEKMKGAELIAAINSVLPEGTAAITRVASRKAGVSRLVGLCRKALLTAAPEAPPTPTKERKKPGIKGFSKVEALRDGLTTLQANSQRRKVYETLARLGGKVEVTRLEQELGFNPRPFLIKLRITKHVLTSD